MNKSWARSLTIIISALFLFQSQLLSQGLRFVGLEQSIEKRTSFNVFGGKGYMFQESLDLVFQLYLYPEENARFGYFFRIKDKGKEGHVWNLSYERNPQADNVTLRFNEEGEYSLIKLDFTCQQLPELEWVDVELHIDLRSGVLTLKIGENVATGDFVYGREILGADLIFGVSDYVTDLPSFAIRNLEVGDSRSSVSFPFTESRGNIAHDSDTRSVGSVVNPSWMITHSLTWEKIGSLEMSTFAGSGYDPDKHRFYYYNEFGVYIMDLIENNTSFHRYANECPIEIGSGDNYYFDGKVTAYIAKNFSDREETMVASLDLDTFEWTSLSKHDLGIDIYHHTGFVDPSDSTYYVFGGNGWPNYNGKFFALSRDGGSWQEIEGWENVICPRFFVSSGVDDGFAYFFGGMGNISGEQVIGKKYFYDFHRIDLSTGRHDLLWSLPTPESNFVPVSTMIIDGGYAYTLCYPEYISESQLTLHRFSIESGEDTQLGSMIPMCSDKLFTNAKLYIDRQLERLFVLTQTFSDDIASKLDIYQINWPVMFESDTFEDRMKESRNRKALVFAATVLLMMAAGCVFFYRRKKSIQQSYVDFVGRRMRRKRTLSTLPRNSIFLFGMFQIVDSKGNDISGRITAQQRDILLLILKYSASTGISSERLSKVIWPDKEVGKAKNSRGVAINKLRNELAGVEGINIQFEDGNYRVVVDEGSYCDIIDFDRMGKEKDIDKVLEIVSRGKFLGFCDNPIFDSWKGRVEESLAFYLKDQLVSNFSKSDYIRVLEISDALLEMDPLEESALQYSVLALKALGHSEDAMVRYADFAAEYRKVNDEDYPIPFNRISKGLSSTA